VRLSRNLLGALKPLQETVSAYSLDDDLGPIWAFAATVLLPLFSIFWLVPQLGLPLWLTILSLLFFAGLIGNLVWIVWQQRRLVPLGFRRVFGGPARVEVGRGGIVFHRRWTRKCFGWDDVREAERSVEPIPGEQDEHITVLHLANGAEAWVDDDAEWSRFTLLDKWAGGKLRARCA